MIVSDPTDGPLHAVPFTLACGQTIDCPPKVATQDGRVVTWRNADRETVLAPLRIDGCQVYALPGGGDYIPEACA